MRKYKKWSLFVVAYLVVFVAFNYCMWAAVTEDLLTDKRYHSGGLDRLGYIIGSKHFRNSESTLPRRVIEGGDYNGESIDVLTIGDSFSNMKSNGRDPLYQDWIASLYDYNVLNIQPLRGYDPVSTILMLLNSGYLDVIRPRFIIIEIVERYCIDQISRPFNLSLTMPMNEIEAYYRTAKYHYDLPEVKFINTGNFRVIRNALLYRYSDNAFSSGVYARELDRPFFSVRNDRKLLFFKEDLSGLLKATPASIQLLNDNLNRLSAKLKKKNIDLCFMPAADKYNVYSRYIRNNPYPESNFFELLRPLPKSYHFVDTKKILRDEVERGEVDVYYADDTHWSWKASKKIAERANFLGRIRRTALLDLFYQ